MSPVRKKSAKRKAAKKQANRKKSARKKAARKKAAKKAGNTSGKKAAKKAGNTSRKKAVKKKSTVVRKRAASKRRGVDLAMIRRAAMAWPGVEEGPSYGTPGFRVKKKLFLRIHQGGDDLVVRLDDDLCEMLMTTEPTIFHKTPHYEGHPFVLARLAIMSEARLLGLVEDAWRISAPARLVAEVEG